MRSRSESGRSSSPTLALAATNHGTSRRVKDLVVLTGDQPRPRRHQSPAADRDVIWPQANRVLQRVGSAPTGDNGCLVSASPASAASPTRPIAINSYER